MDLKESLLKAAEIIEEAGWFSGYIQSPWYEPYGGTNKVCLGLSLVRAGSEDALKYVSNYLGPSGNSGLNTIKWNDEPGRTKKEVLELLRKLASEIGNEDSLAV